MEAATLAVAEAKTSRAAHAERWLDDHGDALFAFARRTVRERTLAEDLVQDTLLAAMRARERFAGEASERTWLIGILKHKIVDSLRRRGREQLGRESDAAGRAVGDLFDGRGVWRTSPRAAPDPADDAERAELRWAIDECLDRLPRRTAEVFRLYEGNAVSARMLGQALGESPTNIWTIMHRARTLLRECLDRTWFGADRGRDT